MVGFVVGITGGTGTGKSVLAGYIRRLGAAYYSVDVAAHALLARDRALRARLVGAFGEGIASEGGISRAALGSMAFRSPAGLSRLNALVHPALRREAKAAVCRMRARHRVVAVEAGAILFDLGLAALSDTIVAVRCDRATRLRRLIRRARLTRPEAARRIAMLRPAEARMEEAVRGCRRACWVDGAAPPRKLAAFAATVYEEAYARTSV